MKHGFGDKENMTKTQRQPSPPPSTANNILNKQLLILTPPHPVGMHRFHMDVYARGIGGKTVQAISQRTLSESVQCMTESTPVCRCC